MIKYEITFPINDTLKIIIPLSEPIEFLGPIYQEHILLFHNQQKLILSKSTVYHNMLYLADLLEKALNSKLFLHPSITQDIGYYHNEYLANNTNFPTQILADGNTDWVGYFYHLWSARENLSSFDSWIYNAPNGDIVFKVTPLYPYMYSEPEKETDYIPYEQWIKNYKPYLMIILPKVIAEQWLKQAKHVVNTIQNNEKK